MIELLRPGKYKGVDFIIKSSTINGGRKDIKHQFPNSSKQTIEDLGPLPKSFNLTVFVADPNYFQKRDSLLKVLDEGGAGILTHPFYGDIPNIVARTYSVNEEISNVGEAIFSINFDVDNDDGLPKEDLDVIGNIESQRKSLVDSVSENITDNYLVENKFQNNFREARIKLISLNEKVRKETNFVFKIQDGANEFNSLLADFGNNINELVTKPANLATSITSMFDSIDSLYVNIKDSFDVYGKFSDFGDSDIRISATTKGLQERYKADDVLNSSVKAISLAYQYQNSSKLDFNTVEEIEKIERDIEKNYKILINKDGLSDDSLSILKDLRSSTSRFFKNEKLTVDKLTTIRVSLSPARVIAYQYYADSSIGETIINLNSISNPTFVDGDIKVLTQ